MDSELSEESKVRMHEVAGLVTFFFLQLWQILLLNL